MGTTHEDHDQPGRSDLSRGVATGATACRWYRVEGHPFLVDQCWIHGLPVIPQCCMPGAGSRQATVSRAEWYSIYPSGCHGAIPSGLVAGLDAAGVVNESAGRVQCSQL